LQRNLSAIVLVEVQTARKYFIKHSLSVAV